MRTSSAFLIGSFLALAGCQIYPPTPTPDYTIYVEPTAKGMAAIPPECPGWATAVTDPYDNEPVPQFGCANARNLALTVEQPGDLLQGRELGPTRSVTLVGSMRRYDNNQTRGLIDPSSSSDTAVAITTSSNASSAISGDATGGGASGGGGGTGGSTSAATSSAAAP